MTQKCVALLGKRDEPTDAVEEYCRYLGGALRQHGFDTQVVRVPWREKGWSAALRELKQQGIAWRGVWVLVQYTALSWSPRGFPSRFLRVLKILRSEGARIGVVYHDVEPYAGTRMIDRLRSRAQRSVMRQALRLADLAVFTVPTEKLAWIRRPAPNAVFIPVGANLAAPESVLPLKFQNMLRPPTIAIYGITGGKAGIAEMKHIAGAVEHAISRIGKLRLLVFGRNSELAAGELPAALRNPLVEVEILGLLSGEKVVESLRSSDVLLFVRGTISSRRGSAIAGIACGLPVVAMEGPETAPPITEAGVVLLSPDASYQETGETLARVLTDSTYRGSLAARSRKAYEKFFSWQAIAGRYAEALRRQE